MRKRTMAKKLLSIFALTILVASTVAGCGGGGGSPCSSPTILSIAEGSVFVMKAGTNDWIEAQVEMELEVGDSVKTGDISGAEITFFDGSTMELEAGTQIEILSLDVVCATGVTTITILQTIGTTISRVTKLLDPGSSYEVETQSGAAAVRGSAMVVTVDEDGTTWITNLEGDVWAVAQGVELQLTQGQQCIISPGQPPRPVMVAAGVYHTVGLRKDGTVVAVGNNTYGQCNVSGWTNITQVSAGFYHTVGLCSNGTVVTAGSNSSGQCNVGNWTDIIQLSAGHMHTVGLKSDGTAVAVGYNYYGQCNVSGWTNIIQVSAGTHHTVGLCSNGTVVTVGSNSSGQRDVSGWTDIIQISTSGYYTVGIRSNGIVAAVGDNSSGQCSVNTWTDIIQVDAGYMHTVGLSSNGTAVAVGYNYYGQCNVTGWTGIIQLATGLYHTVGLKTDGTVVAVGDNSYGQCNVSSWDLR